MSKIGRNTCALVAALALLFAAAACSDDSSTPPKDTGQTGDSQSGDGAGGDAKVGDSGAPATSLKVAAIQFGSDQFGQVNNCATTICALTNLIEQAATNGAKIIVTPEYAFGQKTAEQSPEQGDKIIDDTRWPKGKIIQTAAELAVKHSVTVVINVITQQGTGATAKIYNTQLAIGAEGKVLARHYKFHLFGNEVTQLTAGDSVKTNFFDTPIGKVGLLICADIQCIVFGSGPDCPARNLKLLQEYTAQGAVATFFSAYWTVGPTNAGSSAWWPLNVQKKYSVDAKQWVIAANTSSGPGQGGGIFKPGGEKVIASETGKPAIIYAELPISK